MNARLKDSITAAENTLPEVEQERLALLIEAYTANYPHDARAHFSEAELDEIQRLEMEPDDAADPTTMRAFFAKYGLTPQYEL